MTTRALLSRVFAQEEFTGWHMAGVIGLFFGTIIAVNITLAVFATQSWTGLITKNPYVESQRFEAKRAVRLEQAAMGWKAETAYVDGIFSVTLTDRSGEPIKNADVRAMIGRPAFEQEDRSLSLIPNRSGTRAAGTYQARTDLSAGIWMVTLDIRDADGRQWIKDIRFNVSK